MYCTMLITQVRLWTKLTATIQWNNIDVIQLLQIEVWLMQLFQNVCMVLVNHHMHKKDEEG